jgi:acyl-coenzyme A synthetase/AMP-(fatty) acid ligase
VQIPHRALANFLAWGALQLGIVPETVLLAVTSLSFDIAALELWLPLAMGAKVVIASVETAVDADAIRALLASSGSSVMQATPTTWRMLTHGGQSLPGHLLCLCGGEAWEFSLAAKLMASGCRVTNLYGPTEATIWSTSFEVSTTASRLSLGRPIANTQVYVVDPQMELALVGTAGELYIGGAGVGRGYLNQPEMTAAAFVPDPFTRGPGGRLYRTGDRVRWLANGTLEFLGRLDHQVKIRGYRIELGEVEAVLLQAAGVRHCAVTVREDKAAGPRLVAYIVGEPGVGDRRQWRRLAQEKLPEYMVPSVYVSLDELPLTPNGKVDRRALPAPQEEPREYLAPRTGTEAIVAGIWADVLKRERVGVGENFFEAGGHSLLATQVLSRIRREFNIDLPLRSLFEMPTIANIAEQVALAQHAPRADHPKIERVTQTGAEKTLSELDSLSEDQLDQLIAQFSASPTQAQ